MRNHCDTYHLTPFPDGKNYEATQFHNTDLGKGSVVIFKPAKATPDSLTLPLKGLRREKQYTLTFEDRVVLNAVVSGAVLMDVGVHLAEMAGAEASEVIWLHEEH